MIIIILAAGRGNRLKNTLPKSFPYITKATIPINNQPAIKRLIKQFVKIKQTDVLLVLGHQYKSVLEVINESKQNFVLNNNYETDSNLRSLFLALKKIINEKIFNIDKGVLIIEADSFFSSEILAEFLKYIDFLDSEKSELNKICWTTKGVANLRDIGGFIDPYENIQIKRYGKVKNVYIKNKANHSKTMKMYGMTWLNHSAANYWYYKAKSYLRSKGSEDLTGYFHEIIFNNFDSFSNNYYDLGKDALTFNNYDEYIECLDSQKL